MADFYCNNEREVYVWVTIDENTQSPREWGCSGSRFVILKHGFESPDPINSSEFSDWEDMFEFFGTEYNWDVWDERKDAKNLIEGANKLGYVLLPVYVTMERTGLSYSTKTFNDGMDSGMVGVIYMSKDEAQKDSSSFDESEIMSYLAKEVAEYNRWVNHEDIFVIDFYDKYGELIESVSDVWLDGDESVLDVIAKSYNNHFQNNGHIEMEACDVEELGDHVNIQTAIFEHERALRKAQDRSRG